MKSEMCARGARGKQQRRSFALAVVSSLVLCIHVVPTGHAQELGRTRFVQWTYQDAAALMQQVGRKTPTIALSSVFLVSGAFVDTPVLHGVQEGYRGEFASFLDHTNELGGPRALPVVAGIFASSLLTDNTRFQDAAFTSLQSLLYAGAMTRSLKLVAGRFRPEDDLGAYQFSPFTGENASFPSGHTTAAFAIVTPWVLYYPNPVTYGLFVVASGTAVARIAHDKHWPTDVLAGAAIGFFTACYLTRRHQQQDTMPRIDLTPIVSDASAGVHLRVNLN